MKPSLDHTEVQYRTMDRGEVELTADDMTWLRHEVDTVAAQIYDARLVTLERILKTSFVELGLILCEVEDRKLWTKITDPATGTWFTSFERWVCSRAPVSRSHAFAAKGAVRALIPDVPMRELQQMPEYAIQTMRRLSPAVRKQPRMLEAAKTLSENDLHSHVVREHPDQHFEGLFSRRLRFAESARDSLTNGMEAAMWCYDVTTWEEAIENMLAYFMDGWCEREDCQGMKNQEAFEGRFARSSTAAR